MKQLVDIPWIESFPDGWEVYPLFHFFSENKKKNKGMIENNLLSLSYGKIIQKDINTNTGLLPESFETYQVLDEGDIVLRLTDLQNDKKSLRVGLVTQKGIITSAYVGLRKKREILSHFIYQLLHSYDLQKVFYNLGGGLRQSLRYEELKRIPILVPNFQEQVRISNYLDDETQRIDELIIKKERQIDLLHEKRRSMVDLAFKSESTEYLRLGYVSSPIFRDIQREDDKEYTPVGLYNRGRGIFHKPLTIGSELGDSTFSWIEEDDVILSGQFSWEGAVSYASRSESECICSHRYSILNSHSESVLNSFLFALFDTQFGNFILNEHSRGAAGRNRPLNLGSLLKEKIPIPCMDIQDKIHEQIELERKVIPIIKKSIELLKEYRSSLVVNIVSGKIDISKHEVSK